MTFTEADNLLQGRCRNRRKLRNNTYLVRNGKAIYVRLHSTHILAFFQDGRIELTTGGWNTVTTRSRMNQYLPTPWGVTSCSREFGNSLILHRNGEPQALANSVTIPADGMIEETARKELELRREEVRQARNERNRRRYRELYWIQKARTGGKVRTMPTVEQIQAETNVTIRTAMITVFGLERFLTQVGVTVLDTYNDYQLISYTLNTWQRILALKMVCPSTKTVYIHPVEPRCETVSKALDWMFQTDNYLQRLQAEA